MKLTTLRLANAINWTSGPSSHYFGANDAVQPCDITLEGVIITIVSKRDPSRSVCTTLFNTISFVKDSSQDVQKPVDTKPEVKTGSKTAALNLAKRD